MTTSHIPYQGESSKENEAPECPPAGILKPSGPSSTIRPLQKSISFGDVWVQHLWGSGKTLHYAQNSILPGVGMLTCVPLPTFMAAAVAGSFVSTGSVFVYI